MSEILIDVLDEGGVKTGETLNINDIHIKGSWHRAAHLWVVDTSKRILLQRRSSFVVNHPNKLHITTSGHVDAGETSVDAIRREAKEEIGLEFNFDELVFVGTRRNLNEDPSPNRFNFEFNDVFVLFRDIDISDLVLDSDEVSELIWVEQEDFKNMVKDKDANLVPYWEGYKFLIDFLEKQK